MENGFAVDVAGAPMSVSGRRLKDEVYLLHVTGHSLCTEIMVALVKPQVIQCSRQVSSFALPEKRGIEFSSCLPLTAHSMVRQKGFIL